MILGYFELVKNALKMPQNVFFSIHPNKYSLDLSKEVLLVSPGQRTAKLQAFKVCAVRESNPGRPKTTDSVYKSEKRSLEPKRSRNFFDFQL